MPTIRQARVGEMIKRDLAEILLKEMQDPRLALISITDVQVAKDFTIAKVFVSVIGDAREKAEALKALQGAAGFLRGRLGAMLEMRTVPSLMFRYDTGVDRGVRMFELLREEGQNLALYGDMSDGGGTKPAPVAGDSDAHFAAEMTGDPDTPADGDEAGRA